MPESDTAYVSLLTGAHNELILRVGTNPSVGGLIGMA